MTSGRGLKHFLVRLLKDVPSGASTEEMEKAYNDAWHGPHKPNVVMAKEGIYTRRESGEVALVPWDKVTIQ